MHSCPQFDSFLREAKVAIVYSPRFREYGIELRGSRAVQQIGYCPWCGGALPPGLRAEYFERLERMGHDDVDIETPLEELPPEMRDDRWWRDDPSLSD